MIEEVIGQLREMADVRGVRIDVASPLPTITADAARLELVRHLLDGVRVLRHQQLPD